MKIFDYITSLANTWLSEMKVIVKDEGVLLFFIILPICYPLIYSWAYNNEVVREVPVVLVDDSHSSLSREFAEKFDASPDVSIALHCNNMGDAQDAIGHGKAYGILYFPEDFAKRIGRMEQAHVSVYCDMSYVLTYKAIFTTATAISQVMGTELQTKLLGNKTDREDQIATKPLDFDEVPLFNVTMGYGNFIIIGVLALIIQQAMALGVGLIAGTEREKRFVNYKSKSSPWLTAVRMLLGKSTAYIMVFSIMLAWITLIVPHLFGFVSMLHAADFLAFMTPYLLACAFFTITISELVRYRENVMLVVVFSSVPLLFLSGVSWPQCAIPGFWQGVSVIFPSTFCIRGFIRMNSMGALLPDVISEYHALWIQATVYLFTALAVMWNRSRIASNA